MTSLQIIQRTLGWQNHTYYVNAHGKKQGPYIVERSNQAPPAVHEIRYYVDDNLDGPITTFHANNNIQCTGNYCNGEKHGKFMYYYLNGLPMKEEHYKYNTMHGKWITYHTNGTKASQKIYKDGVQTGTEYGWDRDGDIRICVTSRR
jgi:antitoxin component YwqK of YwqJK toxin-antitoxin module